MAKRYDQMIPIVRDLRPRTIVEIGVHKGIRASKLCAVAAAENPVSYVGYDVFDMMDAQFQEDALNGKGAPSEAEARRRLDGVRGKFTWHFVIGDTRETLHGQTVVADFVFIDGDHRVDAIAGDYAAVAASRCVVFDDYYRPDKAGRMPDVALYGANATVDALAKAGRNVRILPVGDVCKHGGVSHLAVVRL